MKNFFNGIRFFSFLMMLAISIVISRVIGHWLTELYFDTFARVSVQKMIIAELAKLWIDAIVFILIAIQHNEYIDDMLVHVRDKMVERQKMLARKKQQ